MRNRKRCDVAAFLGLCAACATARCSTVYSNLIVRTPLHGDESISGASGVILDDVLVPNALNPTGGALPVTSVTFGILREDAATAVTVTGYYAMTTVPRVDSFPQMINPPTSFGSATLDAYSGAETTQNLTIMPNAPFLVTPQITDVPGYNEFAIGLQFSPERSGNLWAVAMPNSPSANLDGAWDYDIPSNTNAAYALEDQNGPIYTTFMMSVSSTLPSVWSADANGTWSSATSWLGGVPMTNGDGATFGSAITAPRTITLDAPVTLSVLNFNNANAYTIAGTSTLSMDATSGSVSITVSQGSHVIATPLNLNKDATVTISGSSTLTIQGNLTVAAGVGLTKAGTGAVVLNNARMDGLMINQGTVRIANNGTAAGTSNVKNLTIAGSLDAWMGRLDLANNSLVVDYTGTSPRASIENMVKSGYSGGSWSGTGITSASAQASGASLGVAEASDLFTSFPAIFQGQSVDSTAVLIRYTKPGDANLDGSVNTLDFALLAANFNLTGGRWYHGDFNFDGVVNALDFNALATNFGTTIPVGVVSSSLVPEPVALLILSGLIPVAGARHRRSVYASAKRRW